MRPMADDTELSEGERTVLLLHPHWKILLRPTLVLLLVVVAAALLAVAIPAGAQGDPGRIAVGVVAGAAVVAWVALPVLRWQPTSYHPPTRPLLTRRRVP